MVRVGCPHRAPRPLRSPSPPARRSRDGGSEARAAGARPDASRSSRAPPSAASSRTIRPRIESDLGFRVPARSRRRLVNVGDARQGRPAPRRPSTRPTCACSASRRRPRPGRGGAALDQAEAELTRIQTLSRPAAGRRPPSLERQQAATEEARGRLARAERALSLGRERALLRDARAPTRTAWSRRRRSSPARSWPPARPRSAWRAPARRRRWSRSPRRWSARSRGGRREHDALVRPRPALRGALCASSRPRRRRDPHLPRPLLAPGRRPRGRSSA